MKENNLLVIWTTTRCNLNCRYCYASAEKEGQDMDWETVAPFLERFQEKSIKVQFAGGEPLLNEKLIWKTAEYIRREKSETLMQIQTNGTRITRETAEKFRAYGIQVGVSLDGLPEVNEYQRGHTKEALRGLRFLEEAGLPVGINAVLTGQNAEKIQELSRLGLMYSNIRGIALDLLRISGRAARNQELTVPTAVQVQNGLEKLYNETKKVEKIRKLPLVIREVEEAKLRLKHPEKAGVHCYASLGKSFVLLPGGNVYPCGSLVGQEAPLSLPEPPPCGDCSWAAWCDKGCPARLLSGGKAGREAECALRRTAFSLAKKENMR